MLSSIGSLSTLPADSCPTCMLALNSAVLALLLPTHLPSFMFNVSGNIIKDYITPTSL